MNTTRGAALKAIKAQFVAAGLPDAAASAEWLLTDVLGTSRAQLYAFPEAEVSKEEAAALSDAANRRVAGEPLQYILGTASFFGLDLDVGPGVLIPRPETELLVERTLQRLPKGDRTVLDAGTGSGCIALALKHAHAGLSVYGIDVSPDALAIASRNALALNLGVAFERLDLLHEDAASLIRQLAGGPLDVLVSNPPYVPEAERESLDIHVREHEPALALFVEDDPLLFYRSLAKLAGQVVRPGGWLLTEVHTDYASDVARLYDSAGLENVRVLEDYTGRPRIVEGAVS
ncbi:MAG: peptide chain release factor N(5)-glutamine methyltransferase [Bacteroidota bacterium]